MHTSQYLGLAHTHLNDSSTNQLLHKDPTRAMSTQFNKYLLRCKEQEPINTKLYAKLIIPERIDTQKMYSLPKLPKDPIKLRPMVSATNGPTENASAYLDGQLQPYMKRVTSCIKTPQN